MKERNSIFRPESLKFKKDAWLGSFTVSTPSVLPAALGCAIAVIIIFVILSFTTYSKKVPVNGRIIYNPAAVEVVFNQDGIIDNIAVNQGRKVKKGDTIASISHDVSYAGGGMNKSLQDAAQSQLNKLQKREVERHQEGEKERQLLLRMISTKSAEISAIHLAITTELERQISLKKRLGFYQKLLEKGVSTVQEKNERENDYYNTSTKINMQKINLLRAQGEKIQLEDELSHSSSKENQYITDIYQQKVTLQQKIISASAVVESRVLAPRDGIITSMSIFEGQRVSAGKVAAVIVPENSHPFIEMWLPPFALQEVKLGQHVMLRVESLPWEWFGKIHGKVTTISLSPELITGSNQRFRILITPDATTQILPAGVKVEADIMTSHRRIWEWIFSPVKNSIQRILNEE